MKKLWGLVVLLPALLVSQGCGGSGKPSGKLTGTITHKNQNVIVGLVTVSSKDAKQTDTALVKDGSYTCNKAPIGEVYVSFSLPGLDMNAAMEKRKMKDQPDARMKDQMNKPPKDQKAPGKGPNDLSNLTDEQKKQFDLLTDLVLDQMDGRQAKMAATVKVGEDNTFNIILK